MNIDTKHSINSKVLLPGGEVATIDGIYIGKEGLIWYDVTQWVKTGPVNFYVHQDDVKGLSQ